MHSENIAISVRQLRKTYRLFRHPGDRVKSFLSLGLKNYHKEHTALREISFDIRRGETVGIVGRNGAGKSTLLQLICGILKPTQGAITVNGRVSALLELGSGFNPEFTGRENIYFQGAIQGFSEDEITRVFDDIASFADIGDFLEQPVRTYSSGMFIRLAFAASVHSNPEILIVDEALAVGDASFQAKSFRRMQEMRDNGSTILFVSHSLDQIIQTCSRALLLDSGRLVADGEPKTIANRYLDLLSTPRPITAPRSASKELFHTRPCYHAGEYRWGDKRALIVDYSIRQNELINPASLFSGKPVELIFNVCFQDDIKHPVFGLTIKSKQGITLFGTNSNIVPNSPPVTPRRAGEEIWVSFQFTPWLHTDDFFISLGVAEMSVSGDTPLDRRYDAIKISIRHSASQTGVVAMNPYFCYKNLE